MHKLVVILVVVVLGAIFMEDRTTCQAEMLSPPTRPPRFTSPEQVREYLKQVNQYYAIIGRPRFGKRNYGSDDRYAYRRYGEDFSDDLASVADNL